MCLGYIAAGVADTAEDKAVS